MAGELYLVAREETREVLAVPPGLTRVPGAKTWVKGIANVRGQLLPIIDLRQYLGSGVTPNTRNVRVIVVNHREVPAGLLVDEVLGFRRFSESEFTGDAPPTVVRCERYLAGAFRRGPEAMAGVEPASAGRKPVLPGGRGMSIDDGGSRSLKSLTGLISADAGVPGAERRRLGGRLVVRPASCCTPSPACWHWPPPVPLFLMFQRVKVVESDFGHREAPVAGAAQGNRAQPAGHPAAARRTRAAGGRRPHRAGHGHRRHHRHDRRLDQLRHRRAARPGEPRSTSRRSSSTAPPARRRRCPQHLAKASSAQSKQIAGATESAGNMASSTEAISGNSERASDVARHSVDVAHKGGDAVRRTIDGMNTIRETIQETSKRIKRLGESSQEIGNIVELINDIAEQTNILALNASIQASMAGDAGRGFAVVADEVQRLAERAAAATRQIETLVRAIQADTNEAVVSMERSTTDVVGGALLAENAGAALEEIEQVSNQIASLVNNIFAQLAPAGDRGAEDRAQHAGAARRSPRRPPNRPPRPRRASPSSRSCRPRCASPLPDSVCPARPCRARWPRPAPRSRPPPRPPPDVSPAQPSTGATTRTRTISLAS